MSAAYPSSAKAFTPIVDGSNYPQAADINQAYDEITALEQALVTTGLAHNLFADLTATRDLGTSAVKWRDLYLSRNATIGGTLASTGDTTIATSAISAVAATQAVAFNGSVAWKVIFATLDADANNYSPTGWADAGATAAVIQLTGATANRTITGLAGGVSGRVVVFANRSANSYILAQESGSSSATNRFRGPAAALVTIRTDGGVMCVYDGSRWQAMAI